MARIVISENVSLDGVMEDPTGEEGTRHGGWFLEFMNGDRDAWERLGLEQALAASALLLGRRSDAYFGSRWNSRQGEWAERLNSLPKYVVSSTLEDPVWVNSTVVGGNVVAEVSRLKEQLEGEIVCFASRRLVRTLLEHDLVDELRLIVYPVVLGAGERLFDQTAAKAALRRVESRTVGEGLAYLAYEVARG
ncbi:dihydrofolate reductase family protein [Gaiella sp.]|jgi:dihydrofolate reductase|uniref:dihydrofolate reductase family protein n=1 Tax=Gaiella sp. TaxID=2663207 RepID=UPI002E33B4C3|nr:dihydrofolate reductase family protein [Gaiella sp.]HEX5582299.1 dihydrofolate reductase family protein [Gaiella sp.]